MTKLLKKTGGITITEIRKMETDEDVLGQQQVIKRLNLTLSQNSCEP